jgi:inorganic pyrophosphatase
MLKIYSLFIVLVLLLNSCDKKGIGDVKTLSKNNHIHAVVEIPSGTAKVYEYDAEEKGFKNKIDNKIERTYDFLPLPFNYGFIPSTKRLNHSDENKALETVILSEQFSIGTLLETSVLGCLEYYLEGNKNYLFIQNPIYDKAILIKAGTLNELYDKYPDIISIIKIYFENNYNYRFSDILIDKEESEKIINQQIISKN